MKFLTPIFLFAALAAILLAIWFPTALWQLVGTAVLLIIAAACVAAARQQASK